MNLDIFYNTINSQTNYKTIFNLCQSNKDFRNICKKYHNSIIKELHKNSKNIKYINDKLSQSRSEEEINFFTYWGADWKLNNHKIIKKAIEYNNLFFLKYLYDKYNFDFNKKILHKNKEKKYPISFAIEYKQLNIIKYFFSLKIKLHISAFNIAFSTTDKYFKMIEILMEYWFNHDDNFLIPINSIFLSAINFSFDPKVLDLLIYQYNVDINMHQELFLKRAIYLMNINLVKYILKFNPDINHNSDFNPPCLIFALDSPEIFSLLIKEGADIYINNNEVIRSIIKRDNSNLLEILIENGLNILSTKINEQDSITFAIFNESTNIIEYLCYNEYIDKQEINKRLIDTIISNDSIYVVEIFLRYFTITNLRKEIENESYNIFKDSSIEMIELLINNGFEINEKDLELVKELGYPKNVYELLLDFQKVNK
jgi:hypothetical protein